MGERAGIEALEPRRLFNGGDLDHSFGDNGFATLSKGANIFSLFTLDNCEMIVAGNQSDGSPYVRRLFADGSIDSSFTANGLITSIRHELSSAWAYALDIRGGLLIGGQNRQGTLEILRVTPQGAIDPHFGSGGLSVVPLQRMSSITALPDGRTVVAGVSGYRSNEEDSTSDELHGVLVLAKNGKVDKNFNGGAPVQTADLYSRYDGYIDADNSLVSEYYLPLSDGRFVGIQDIESSSSIETGDGQIDYPPSDHMSGAIYLPDGRSPDIQFPEDGALSAVLCGPPQDLGNRTFKVFYASESDSSDGSETGSNTFSVVVNSDGSLQTAQPVGDAFLSATQAVEDHGILVLGSDYEVYRATADGQVDTSFHQDAALQDVDNSLYRSALAIAPDGNILAVFNRNPDSNNVSSFVVKLQRSDAPSGVFEGHDVHTTRTGYYFNVHWHDDDGVDLSSLGNDDVYVILPDGTHRSVKLVSTSGMGGATEITATYRVTLADGQWDATDNGTYQVAIRRGAVSDIHGKFAGGRVIGRFKVNIQPTPEAITIATVMRPAPFSTDPQSLLALAGIE